MTRIATAMCVAFLARLATAQTSELYLTTFNNTTTYVVQHGQIVRQFQRASDSDGPALVVRSTIKDYGRVAGSIGREYTLSGELLSGQYKNTGFNDCLDGATDGTRNWTIAHNDFATQFAVLVGDQDWGGMHVAFVPNHRSSGMAYDPTDDTLWLTNNQGGSDNVQHYSTSGTLLGEFAINLANGGGYGIAFDTADQTLWIPGAFGTAGRINQYSKTGVLLQSVHPPGLTLNVLGAEFGPFIPIVHYCTSGTTTNGCSASIDGTGSASASAATAFVINVNGVEGQRQGILLYGIDNAGFSPTAWGTSTSYLCIKSPTQLAGAQSSGGTEGGCDGALVLDWNSYLAANPTSLGNPFIAGQHVYMQGWFRDPPSPATTLLSNAIDFTLRP